MKKFALALLAACAMAGAAQAQVVVSNAWIRATVPLQKSSGAYMVLQAATDMRLVGARSPLATVELHQMQTTDSRMTMRPVDGVALPAGRRVDLAAGGYHLMLTGLKAQLKEGDAVPLSLEFEDQQKRRSSLALTVAVKPLTYAAPAPGKE
jgi:copper(I)-binding protein